MDYSLHDQRVLDEVSRAAQAAKVLRVLEHFARDAALPPAGARPHAVSDLAQHIPGKAAEPPRSAGSSDLSGAICLDVGCSAGIITRAVAPYVRRMVGVDVDARALGLAGRAEESTSRRPRPLLGFAAASGLALPFADGTFDLALCNQVYQYVPDVPQLLAELHRVLKAGGACYFSARNLWGIASAENRLPFLASISPGAAAIISRGNTEWQHRAGTLWPYRRLRALAARLFSVRDYTTRVLHEPGLAELFVPLRYRRLLASAPLALLEPAKPLLPTHIWILQKRV